MVQLQDQLQRDAVRRQVQAEPLPAAMHAPRFGHHLSRVLVQAALPKPPRHRDFNLKGTVQDQLVLQSAHPRERGAENCGKVKFPELFREEPALGLSFLPFLGLNPFSHALLSLTRQRLPEGNFFPRFRMRPCFCHNIS